MMKSIKSILFPTDFSDYADYSLQYATEFAKKFSAQISILHVCSLPFSTYPDEALAASLEIHKDNCRTSEKRAEELCERLDAEGIEATALIREGTAFVEIITTARELESDLIVMATHGHGVLKHLLIGSTAERVVRKAPCPVLTIRNPEHEFVSP